MHRRLLLALLLAFVACPSVAQARTIQQDIGVGERYWKSNVCRGEWKALPADPAVLRELNASGYTHHRDCTIYYDTALPACEREYVILHEMGHVIHPAHADHTGPMDLSVIGGLPCVGERVRQQRVKARWAARRKAAKRAARPSTKASPRPSRSLSP